MPEELNISATVRFDIGAFTRVEIGCRGCPDKINICAQGLGGVTAARILENHVPSIIEEAVYTSNGLLAGSRNPVDERAGLSACGNVCRYPIVEAAEATIDSLGRMGLNSAVSKGEVRPLF